MPTSCPGYSCNRLNEWIEIHTFCRVSSTMYFLQVTKFMNCLYHTDGRSGQVRIGLRRVICGHVRTKADIADIYAHILYPANVWRRGLVARTGTRNPTRSQGRQTTVLSLTATCCFLSNRSWNRGSGIVTLIVWPLHLTRKSNLVFRTVT